MWECSLLINAALNGEDTVVRRLLNLQPDLEEVGTVKIEEDTIEGASALWSAAAAGHLKVVKMLVRAGADVNHSTKTKSTPLRAACFIGRLDIVKYLVEHKANIHLPNSHNNTCLMVSAFCGHLDVVRYLLKRGADPNHKSNQENTALHEAAEPGHVKIVSELMAYGGKMTKNKHEMTPLLTAAENIRDDVVHLIIQLPEISKEERIEALELLDLEKIQFDTDALNMESLVIRERILGSKNPDLIFPIVYRGAVCADKKQFQRCIALWTHAMNLKQNSRRSVKEDLFHLAGLFTEMLHEEVELSPNHVISVLSSGAEELERNHQQLSSLASDAEDIDEAMEEMESNMHSVLYLLVMAGQLKLPEGDDNIRQIISHLNRIPLKTRHGRSLLHLACWASTPVPDDYTFFSDVCRFPCDRTARLLIECGADVNVVDADGKTPFETRQQM
ncbi:unnamed protein product [Darwinula stevensoni]|uniref:Protein fem-1 homolog B n=1 Tax=Darwinula stevensoni TaxID=69355 RepID=A0A7R8XIV8_9CRUS|nr:unnamed protein product [Darwinula stevensoni]CAG0891631.1 unnamed protein product [Darwinula stevensoni]